MSGRPAGASVILNAVKNPCILAGDADIDLQCLRSAELRSQQRGTQPWWSAIPNPCAKPQILQGECLHHPATVFADPAFATTAGAILVFCFRRIYFLCHYATSSFLFDN
jgi:hypothetical protein